MQPENVTLSAILSGPRQHIIPVFQRSYSWTQKHWKELWSDIQALINEDDKTYEHFMGPMIIDRGDTGSYVPSRHLVIDGQQRLVTLSVLLCTLRDIAKKHGFNHLASSVQELLTFKTTEGEEERRLLPRSADRAAFEKILKASLTPQDNKQPIVKTYRFFHREVRKGLPSGESESFEYLNELYKVTIARLRLVSITLGPSDDPTKIYESMNFKGKPLLIADLIRNYVLMHLPEMDVQDAFYATVWEPFEKLFADNESAQIDSKELEDFYYRYLIAKRDYFAKRLVYASYKDQVSGYLRDTHTVYEKRDALAELVADQKRYARYYRRVMHPELEPDQELKEAFQRFEYLDARTATPFLMSLYARYEDGAGSERISKAVFLRMINAMESFILRRSILRLRTRGYGLDFAQAVKKSQNMDELHEHFDNRDWPEDSVIREALAEFPLYLRERKKSRLILEQLEIAFGHKELVDLSDRERIQIEHILPQKKPLSPEWQAMLGGKAEEVHAKYHQTLGNLTLTGYNQELGAKSFEDKKSEYAKHGSHLELNRYVLEQDRWTAVEIEARAQKMIEHFIEIWPRPARSKRNES